MIKLTKKPKNPVVVCGFPGFGLVGTIATEFLIEHLKTEQIGKIYFNELPAMVAIHKEKIVEPIGIFYNEKYNILVIHAITTANGIEWKIADEVNALIGDLKAKELISLEGVGSPVPNLNPKTFYYSSNEKAAKKLSILGLEPLKEGIVMGVTSALLLKVETPLISIFAETHSELPDSKAAASIIGVLDKYLKLDVDYKPLLATAEKFEEKVKSILSQAKLAHAQKDSKDMSYVG